MGHLADATLQRLQKGAPQGTKGQGAQEVRPKGPDALQDAGSATDDLRRLVYGTLSGAEKANATSSGDMLGQRGVETLSFYAACFPRRRQMGPRNRPLDQTGWLVDGPLVVSVGQRAAWDHAGLAENQANDDIATQPPQVDARSGPNECDDRCLA